MLELIRFDLQNKDDLQLFIKSSEAYYSEICTKEECEEEISDLYDEQLTSELINQTLQVDVPYFIMKIVVNGQYVGFIAYSVELSIHRGFINNFYIVKEHRAKGIGTLVYNYVEEHMKQLGTMYIDLEPVDRAKAFYQRRGYSESRHVTTGEISLRKSITAH